MPGLLEPVVGTRSPLPSSGGGQLSPEAILMLLRRQQMMQQQPQQNLGIGAPAPGSYLTNPQAYRDAQIRAAGG